MFDLGWSELLIVGILALVVIGPKELPAFMSLIGKWAGYGRRALTELRFQMDDVLNQSDLDTPPESTHSFSEPQNSPSDAQKDP